MSVSVNALLEQRKGSDEGATKMLHYASLPASSLVSSALEKMCKDSISMILVTKGTFQRARGSLHGPMWATRRQPAAMTRST